MASRLFLLALAGSAALAQMSGMGMATTAESDDDAMATDWPTAMPTWTEEGITTTLTSIPSAIMPFDISVTLIGSTTPTTLVVDTMTPPAPSSSVAWAMATSGNMVPGMSTSGVAMWTGSPSANATSTGGATVNGMSSAYSKISYPEQGFSDYKINGNGADKCTAIQDPPLTGFSSRSEKAVINRSLESLHDQPAVGGGPIAVG
ncbi:hypothetical protein VMCG_01037 [Cytospora schulzeri]|uniref:Uncharacterized protein n=1 Tax=Cytospora schulzeri TaxID=448051 RepID=A0A423X5C0_9PEZI|nr:hypothetical protein VMCG_01037 [Valsa malicola]